MKSTETLRVGIVGAGFSGCLTAAQILRQATTPIPEIRALAQALASRLVSAAFRVTR